MYTVRYIGAGSYYVLIKKYITNFTNVQMVEKVYSAYSIVTGIGNALISAIASAIVARCNLIYSTLIFGAISTLAMILLLKFMKTIKKNIKLFLAEKMHLMRQKYLMLMPYLMKKK